MAGGKSDRRQLKGRLINGLTYLLSDYTVLSRIFFLSDLERNSSAKLDEIWS